MASLGRVFLSLSLLLPETSAFVVPVGHVRPVQTWAATPGASMGLFDFLAAGKAGAKHILVRNRADAITIMNEIKGGKTTFEDAAKKYSTCPSASKGGDLGTFGPGEMVGAFNDYCFDPSTPLNEPGVVTTQFGAHIIKLTKKP
ncbi:hypothetical protein AB1Y20_001426 [Prymnesium parvum]|uniref:Peptidyl-prolyl cis-trans isomerase n=1 Tax=Prymnesium parvum TaxID=97485 RepID=A0AB34K8P3_PRYPA